MSLFQNKNFLSHSGKKLDWKVECGNLYTDDWATIASLIADRIIFSQCVGVPRGGLELAAELEQYEVYNSNILLIVDDVLTTGKSMEEARVHSKKWAKTCNQKITGVVLFARGPCPDWVTPIFQLHEKFRP